MRVSVLVNRARWIRRGLRVQRHAAHDVCFVEGTVTGAAGKNQGFDDTGALQVTRGPHTIIERLRRFAVGIGARAENERGVGRAAVVGLSEEVHLRERKGDERQRRDACG